MGADAVVDLLAVDSHHLAAGIAIDLHAPPLRRRRLPLQLGDPFFAARADQPRLGPIGPVAGKAVVGVRNVEIKLFVPTMSASISTAWPGVREVITGLANLAGGGSAPCAGKATATAARIETRLKIIRQLRSVITPEYSRRCTKRNLADIVRAVSPSARLILRPQADGLGWYESGLRPSRRRAQKTGTTEKSAVPVKGR